MPPISQVRAGQPLVLGWPPACADTAAPPRCLPALQAPWLGLPPTRQATHSPPLLLFQSLPLLGHGLMGSQPPVSGPASRIRNSMSTSQHFPSFSFSTHLRGQGEDEEDN